MNTLNLGELTPERFLREYWQKKPLLIRNAFADFQPVVEADELAGLACEDEVESRLVVQSPDSDDWSLRQGPFGEDDFASLPPSHWTLLVQAVDHWVPEAAELMAQFDFIPSWRRDDLMISYAVDGGGVGPHYDNYDVFLIQASGRRRWELGGRYDETSPRREDAPVMILPDWQAEESWVLEPGDMLYVPPQVGHNGFAVGDDCMTYSVGFRAPSHAEIMRHFTDFVGERLRGEDRYRDADLGVAANPAEIGPDAIQRLREILHRYIDDDRLLGEWFGRYMTEPKYAELDQAPEEPVTVAELREFLDTGGSLSRNEGTRLAYRRQGDGWQLFADGELYRGDDRQGALFASICGGGGLELGEDREFAFELLTQLVNQGVFFADEPD
ncbi:cupin [Marinobacterium nitratireducens]|uniref:Cupin n=1 Tax=Marinobacterium nitratireducens TaxID=518897 RepID=A0A917Z9L0_9GAMM|nr:cupin domain-containing protein [Marinobacterium nitratireducens]GGO76953.1 cupin [Marinobacterium nitratireducens]